MIVPVEKVTNTLLCEEFRGINIVLTYEGVLELTVKNQLTEFCVRHSIIIKSQSGFRTNYSYETQVSNICDKWIKEVDQSKMGLAVFLYLQ